VPIVYNERYAPEIGKGIVLRDGGDVTLVGCGVVVPECIEAARALERRGIQARVVEMHTVKPIDAHLIAECARETAAIVTVEEHSVIGGLGGAVAEVLAATTPTPLERVGLQDIYAETGPYADLLDKYGLTARHVVEAAEKVLARKPRTIAG
jgi:transketolase